MVASVFQVDIMHKPTTCQGPYYHYLVVRKWVSYYHHTDISERCDFKLVARTSKERKTRFFHESVIDETNDAEVQFCNNSAIYTIYNYNSVTYIEPFVRHYLQLPEQTGSNCTTNHQQLTYGSKYKTFKVMICYCDGYHDTENTKIDRCSHIWCNNQVSYEV